jgi:hypothetical protein
MQYRVMSQLEHKLLNVRKIDENYGYFVEDKKSGVFLKSAGEKVEPIFSKGEVEGEEDEYIMIFAPVKDRQDWTEPRGRFWWILLANLNYIGTMRTVPMAPGTPPWHPPMAPMASFENSSK